MKVCVIGLDGATWNLLDPWMEDLPTIRSFATSTRSELDSCIPPLSMPAWKCYSTGMNPGDLGVFTFVEPDFEAEQFVTVTNDSFVTRELWDYLGEAGHRSAVVNMPTTYPPREIPGWMVSGPFSGEQAEYTYPPDLEATLEERGYEILPEYYLSRDPDDLDDARASVRTKLETALSFTDRVDFLHLTVYLTDTVQHTEWDSPVSKSFWEAIDEELGRFLGRLDDEWNVLLISDHGFGSTKGRFYLNTWLEDQGHMRLDDSGFDVGDLFATLGVEYEDVLAVLRRLGLSGVVLDWVPGSLLRTVARRMPGNRKLEGLQGRIDWDSDAIALAPLVYTKDHDTAVEIREGLLELTGPDGESVVDEVYFGADIYPDSEVRAPDLVVAHTEYGISDIVKPGVTFEFDGGWRSFKTAHHRRAGILTARGPDVRPNALDGATPRLYDLAPTVLDGFGIDVPEAMRGESIGLLGSNAKRRDRPIDRDVDRVVAHDEAVERKLKDLGYL
jgi:predicted AlkP superfamily phosphohydrolase/phosphomutase